jgi:hypothetical protein
MPAALGTFNSIALALNTPMQLIAPGTGHYTTSILNTTAGNLYISDLSNAGANVTSFKLPTGLYSPALSSRAPLWISADAAGSVSVYCAPR